MHLASKANQSIYYKIKYYFKPRLPQLINMNHIILYNKWKFVKCLKFKTHDKNT
jgi:dTDP-4-dehydrorhamnose 3,5-epimerase-like enzyme